MTSDGTWSTREKGTLDTEDEDEDTEHDANEHDANENVAEKDDELGHSENDKETESKEASEKGEGQDDEDFGKDKQEEKKPSKKQPSSKKERVKMEGSSRKTPSTSAKSPSKAPSSIRSKSYELNDEGEKVFVRKKKQIDLPKKTSTSKSDIKEKSSGMCLYFTYFVFYETGTVAKNMISVNEAAGVTCAVQWTGSQFFLLNLIKNESLLFNSWKEQLVKS